MQRKEGRNKKTLREYLDKVNRLQRENSFSLRISQDESKSQDEFLLLRKLQQVNKLLQERGVVSQLDQHIFRLMNEITQVVTELFEKFREVGSSLSLADTKAITCSTFPADKQSLRRLRSIKSDPSIMMKMENLQAPQLKRQSLIISEQSSKFTKVNAKDLNNLEASKQAKVGQVKAPISIPKLESTMTISHLIQWDTHPNQTRITNNLRSRLSR